jgi:adenine specific DNA methylase Mod
MKEIKLVIESSLGSVLEESEKLVLSESWKSNEAFLNEMKRITRRAKNIMHRWAEHGEEHTAKVVVEFLSSSNVNLNQVREIEKHLEEMMAS